MVSDVRIECFFCGRALAYESAFLTSFGKTCCGACAVDCR